MWRAASRCDVQRVASRCVVWPGVWRVACGEWLVAACHGCVWRGELSSVWRVACHGRVACGVSQCHGPIRCRVASGESRLRCEETKLPSFGGVWSAGRVASGLTRVACGVTVWRAACAGRRHT